MLITHKFGFGYFFPALVYSGVDHTPYYLWNAATRAISKCLIPYLPTIDLKKKSEKDIWLIGGGQLIIYFLNNELLDKMILTIIGEGIPLFPDKPKETSWDLKKVEQFETGIVNLTYDRK